MPTAQSQPQLLQRVVTARKSVQTGSTAITSIICKGNEPDEGTASGLADHEHVVYASCLSIQACISMQSITGETI